MSDFHPDWSSSPGRTIADILRRRNLSDVHLAERARMSHAEVSDLLHGKATITESIADRLESVLGGSREFWLTRDAQYRQALTALREIKTPANDAWLSAFPINDMIDWGWIESNPTIESCLAFFGVSSIRAWNDTYGRLVAQTVFKTAQAYESQPGPVVAWLRRGEVQSDSIACMPWNPNRLLDLVPELRALTRIPDPKAFVPALVDHCRSCGIAFVIVRAPKGCRAIGAARFLNPNRAIIQLSFRYLSDDHFWFALFHEMAHLILHGNQSTFIEIPNRDDDRWEAEANSYAQHTLIPVEYESELARLPRTYLSVSRFAKQIGISPGIVVGQLQYRRILGRERLNKLKTRYAWSE